MSRKKLTHSAKSHRGFTIIELILVITIVAILGTVLTPMINSATKAGAANYDISDVMSKGQFAVERISRDLHNIRSNSATDLGTNSSQIGFIDLNGNAVTYSLTGTDLQRNSVTLVTNASNFTVNYYTGAGASTSTATQVCYIRFGFTITSNNISQTFSNTVFVRNASC